MPEALQYAVLHEFVEPARHNLPRGTWDYLMVGAETETTQERNRVALGVVEEHLQGLGRLGITSPTGPWTLEPGFWPAALWGLETSPEV